MVEKYDRTPEWVGFLPIDKRDGKKHIDLRGYIVDQLLALGVREKKIFIAQECTCCARYMSGEPLFDSHHRAKTSGGEGRSLVAAMAVKPPFSLARLSGFSSPAVRP